MEVTEPDYLAGLRQANGAAAFNHWLGLEVTAAARGRVTIELPWRDEFGQYAGFLHAALIGGLIDTACGFAAATHSGSAVLASHFSVNCLAPAMGDRFVAHGSVVRAGRRQIFTRAELFAARAGDQKLVATGETILVPMDADCPT